MKDDMIQSLKNSNSYKLWLRDSHQVIKLNQICLKKIN